MYLEKIICIFWRHETTLEMCFHSIKENNFFIHFKPSPALTNDSEKSQETILGHFYKNVKFSESEAQSPTTPLEARHHAKDQKKKL